MNYHFVACSGGEPSNVVNEQIRDARELFPTNHFYTNNSMHKLRTVRGSCSK